jgi:hypothetical protein
VILDDQRWIRNLVRIGLPAIVLIFYVTAATHFDYTPDDTYIYLQFAKNIVRGDGFAFNQGEPSYGITSPLWSLLISLGGWLGIDLYVAAKGLDLVLACAVLLAVYALALEVMREHLRALLATLAFSANVWFIRWSGTGMETSFAILLAVSTVLFCLRNEYFPAIVLAALMTLTRPEGALLALLVFVDVWMNSLSKKRGWKMAGALFVVYLVLLTPWFVYALTSFGSVLPNTMLAKSSAMWTGADLQLTFTEVVERLAVSDGIAIVVLFVCLVSMLRRRKESAPAPEGMPKDMREPQLISHGEWLRFHFLPLAWIGALPLGYIVAQSQVVSRYLVLVSPFVTVYAFAVLSRLLARRRSEQPKLLLALSMAGVLIAQNGFAYHVWVKPSIGSFTQDMQECLIPIGKWLKANTPTDAVVFAPDIGAIGYYSDRKICDAAALVSPEFLPLVRSGQRLDDIVQAGAYRTLCGASYVVYRSHEPKSLQRQDLEPLFTKIVFGLAVSDMRTAYYTVYKVRGDHN